MLMYDLIRIKIGNEQVERFFIPEIHFIVGHIDVFRRISPNLRLCHKVSKKAKLSV